MDIAVEIWEKSNGTYGSDVEILKAICRSMAINYRERKIVLREIKQLGSPRGDRLLPVVLRGFGEMELQFSPGSTYKIYDTIILGVRGDQSFHGFKKRMVIL